MTLYMLMSATGDPRDVYFVEIPGSWRRSVLSMQSLCRGNFSYPVNGAAATARQIVIAEVKTEKVNAYVLRVRAELDILEAKDGAANA